MGYMFCARYVLLSIWFDGRHTGWLIIIGYSSVGGMLISLDKSLFREME
jgi:hypothetical protein